MTGHFPPDLDHLIVVAGHAVYVADNFADPRADSAWCLQDFQRGEPPFYLEHIQRGVELAADDPQNLAAARQGEAAALALFASDPYGHHGELVNKRAARNPFHRHHDYARSCSELATLLEHRGPELIAGVLPWDEDRR